MCVQIFPIFMVDIWTITVSSYAKNLLLAVMKHVQTRHFALPMHKNIEIDYFNEILSG